MSLSSAIRPLAALALTAVAVEEVLSAATPNEPGRQRVIATLAPRAVPSLAHLLALVAGVLLLVLVPSLWRGTREALLLAVAVLVALGMLNLIKGLDYEETILDASLAALLLVARGSFGLGSQARRRLTIAIAIVGIWAATYAVLLLGVLDSSHARTIGDAVRDSLGRNAILTSPWAWAFDVLVIAGLLASLVLRPARAVDGHSQSDHTAARALVSVHGRDSLAPFVLREDKAFHFARGGVLAYRVLGETAVISGDPVAPPGVAPLVLGSFIEMARERGWQVVLWGASGLHLSHYRELGLRHLHIGEEAFVDPTRFTIEGRTMRKVRQSVHRIQRRGWEVQALSGHQLDSGLMHEVDALERAWRAQQRRIIGFAMGMGPWEAEHQPEDVYLLGRNPDGELCAVMRFIDHCGGLSLDTMRRVGETPNGLNEALVVRALELARERGAREVSLNFAGFAHLMAAEAAELEAHRRLARFLLGLLGERFQMERLVRFNDKFQPEWRPRFLVYDSRTRLPRVGLRVLQAEAYLRGPRPAPLERRWRPQRPPLGAPPSVSGAN
jgi:lysyl-tRNA synthetase class 2